MEEDEYEEGSDDLEEVLEEDSYNEDDLTLDQNRSDIDLDEKTDELLKSDLGSEDDDRGYIERFLEYIPL